MQSTTSRETDPHDIFVIEPDVVLAARADQATANLAHDILSHSSAPQASAPQSIKGPLAALAEIASGVAAGAAPPSVDTTFRAAVSDVRVEGTRPPPGKWARRVFMTLFAICSAAAAVAWQNYGDVAKQMVAGFAPPFVLASSPSPQQPAVAGQPDSPAVQASAGDQAATEPVPRAQSVPSDTAALAPESPLLQSMAHDIASMGQQIEQLKAGIEQLKNSQQQMSRDMAKTSESRNSATATTEPNPRPKISAVSPVSALPPRAMAAPVRRPRPAFAAAPITAAPTMPQTAAAPMPMQPEPPSQLMIQPDGEPVVRPPMPLR